MRIEDIRNKHLAFANFILGSILCLISFFTLNSFLIVLSFFFLLVSVLSFSYGYLLFSIFSKIFGFEEEKTNYKLSKERNCIVTKNPPRASFFLEIKLKKEPNQPIEKLIQAIDFPFKLEIAISKENAEKLIDSLKLKREMLQIELEKAKEKEKIYRKISEIEEEIKEISSANPLNAYFFACVSAEGKSENEAITKAFERAKTLANAIEAIIGGEVRFLLDNEIERAIDIIIFPSGMDEYKNFE
ncbi:MAG: hypothetical protein ACPLXS_01680 [Candidatus Micrarchaeales archaeon]